VTVVLLDEKSEELIIGKIDPGALHINAESLLRETLKNYIKKF